MRTHLTVPLLLAAAAAGGPGHEEPPAPKAADVLRPEMLQGAHHKVRPEVTTEGFLYRFEVESDFGLYEVVSLSLLEKRVHEINTLAKATSMKDDANFLVGVGQSLKQTVTAPVLLITKPIGSVKAIGKGVGKTLRRIGLLFKKREKSEQEDEGLKAALFGAEKRKLAADLKLDVYTDNPKVHEFLDAVARGRGSGKLTVSLGTMAIPGGAGIAVGVAKYRGGVDEALRDLSPAELHDRNLKKLVAMGVHEFVAKSFLNHGKLSPRHKTVITDDLETLGAVADKGKALEAILEGIDDHVEGPQFYENLVGMLVALHKEKHPIARIEAVEGLPIARTEADGVVVALPVDLVHWSEEADAAFSGLALLRAGAAGERSLVVTGKLTDRARTEIEA
ncbi:MAG: hypothetical protein ACREID_04345, partial [Planctomycetota bacterium]